MTALTAILMSILTLGAMAASQLLAPADFAATRSGYDYGGFTMTAMLMILLAFAAMTASHLANPAAAAVEPEYDYR